MTVKFKFEHSCIRVMDLEKSLDFYQKAFGFKVDRVDDHPDAKFTLAFLRDESNNFELELTYNYDQEEPYEIGNGYSHLAVAVSDLEAAHKYHEENGFEVGKIHKFSEDHDGFYFLSDPDGYEIEVVVR